MKIKLIFRWFDLWIGFYWMDEHCKLYIFPIPMLGVMIQFHKYCDNRFVRRMKKTNKLKREELNKKKIVDENKD